VNRLPDPMISFKMSEVLLYKELLRKGAEAYIHEGTFLGKEVLIKERRSKTYRHPELDVKLRKSRIKSEIKVMRDLKEGDVNVPSVLAHDASHSAFAMERILGKLLHEVLTTKPRVKGINACEKLGEQAGKMHQQDIYHGDLTPFNAIVSESEEKDVYLIDFGLAGFSHDIEKYASDLLVLQQTLEGLYPVEYESFFNAFKSGYTETFGVKSNRVFNQLEKILLRGRYVSRKKRKKAGMV
jgi:TP53 regulating kinase-like protein